MSIKTLLAARQVIHFHNKLKGAIAPARVMARVEQLVDQEVLEFVPWSNFFVKWTFRDNRTGAYLRYDKIGGPYDENWETLTAAIPKARQGKFDVDDYARRFKAEHFSDFPTS